MVSAEQTELGSPAVAAVGTLGQPDYVAAKPATGLYLLLENLSARFDTTAPTITGVTLSATGAQNSTLNAGDVVSVTVAFSEPVVVKGLPTIALTVGNDTKQATYVSGGGSNQLVFSYTVEANSTDANGISVVESTAQTSTISLPSSAQIVDTWGNAATLTHAAVTDQASLKVDAVAPTAAAAPAIAEAADKLNATEASDGTDVTVNITGTGAVAGDILTLNWGGKAVNYALQQADIDATSATVTVSSLTIATQGDGSVAVSAFITDAAGNIGATSAATTVTVDTTAPNAPAAPVVAEATLGGINASEAANGTEVVVDITSTGAVEGDTLTIGWGGTSVNHTLSASDITNNSATVTVGQTDITVKDGSSFNVTAQLMDAAGNVGATSAATSVSVDSSKPTASVATSAIANTANAIVQSTEAGTAYLVHRYVTVNSLSDITGADTNLWNSVAISAGGTATQLPAAGLIGGVYDVYTVDAAGNLSAAAVGGGVTVSTTTSTVSLAFNGLSDTGTTDLPPVTRDNAFTLKATGLSDGSTIAYERSTDNGLNWALTNDVQNGLTVGTYLFRAKVTDTSFNTVVTNVLEMTVDTTAPTAPTSVAIKDANDDTISSGSSTKKTTLTLVITAEANAQVAVYDGINFLGWAEETATSGTYQYAVSGLKDGAYAFKAKATDAAGNESALSAAASVTVDTVAPTIVISPVADRDAFYTVAFDQGFSVPQGAVVVASVDGNNVTSQFTATTLNGITTYTAKAGAFTGSEIIKVNATLADAAGNVGNATEVTLGQIDSTAPVLTSASINGKTLVLQYSEAGNLDPLTSPLLSNYTVKVGGQAVGATQAVYDASAKTVTLTLKDSVASTAVVTVDYTPSTVRPLQDTAGNDAAALTDASVTNTTPADAIAPSFVSATVDGNTLTLDYDEALSTMLPNQVAFTVTVNGSLATVNSVARNAVDTSKLDLTLASPVAGGDVVTVAYTAPTADATTSNAAIQDLLGNDAATLAVQNVSNLMADGTAPTATIASADYFERNDTIGANGVVHTLRLTGTDFTTLLSGGESAATNIKSRLDWSKFVWDINNDDGATADVKFEAEDIASVTVASDTTLYITFSSEAGNNTAEFLYKTAGYNTSGGSAADGLDISAGFLRDLAGNAAATDAFNDVITSNQYVANINNNTVVDGRIHATDIVINGRGSFILDGAEFTAAPANLQINDQGGNPVTTFSLSNLQALATGQLTNSSSGSMTVLLDGAANVQVDIGDSGDIIQVTTGPNSILTGLGNDRLVLASKTPDAAYETDLFGAGGSDKIVLLISAFGDLDGDNNGVLDATYFGTFGGIASDVRIAYDQSTGMVSYSSNGSTANAVELVSLITLPSITATDFLVL